MTPTCGCMYVFVRNADLSKLEELLIKINHIVDNRMDANLRMVGDLMLVYLPRQEIFTLDKFVRFQESHVKKQTKVCLLSRFVVGSPLETHCVVSVLTCLLHSLSFSIHLCVCVQWIV